MSRSFVALLIVLVGCTHAGVRAVEPTVRDVLHGERTIESDVKIGDSEVITLFEALGKQDMSLAAVWRVPGVPDLLLAVITRGGEIPESYGPQLVALRDGAVIHETARLFDADFVYPSFVQIEGRTLMFADHGSEDSYGVLVWSFEGDRIRDLGDLPIALPGVEFTGPAASAIRVRVEDGRYVLRIYGQLLLDPARDDERLIEGWTTFEERDGKLVMR